jgi:hypothetical protein
MSITKESELIGMKESTFSNSRHLEHPKSYLAQCLKAYFIENQILFL